MRKKSKKVSHCHKLVAQVAHDMAGAAYDELMKDNGWYERWKAQHPGASARDLETAFIDKLWASMIPEARATLAQMLNGPYSPEMKAGIHEALVLDNSLIRGRAKPALQLN
jgi:hypothetical protein